MNQFFSLNITEIGLFFIGAGYLWVQWKSGGPRASAEVLTIYKSQVEALEKSIEITRNHNHELGN